MKKSILLIIAISFFTNLILATHNHSGNIVFKQIGEKTIEATIHTFTKTSSVAADRDTLIICWGDGICVEIARTSENELTPTIKHNQYSWTHNYANLGSYLISMTDPNRTGGILNVNYPNSDAVAFHLETFFVLSQNQNSSPVILEHPLYSATAGAPFIHIPNPFDAEGDSIAYELTTPKQGISENVFNYEFPQNLNGNGNGTLEIQPINGTTIWETPQITGHYVMAMLIKEYRNGQLISSILRDILIEVNPGFTDNNPPSFLIANDNVSVVAGEVISFNVEINDDNDDVTIKATGGPFEVTPTAQFNIPTFPQSTPLNIEFNWNTTPELARDQPYQVVFTAIDNSDEKMYWQTAVLIYLEPEPTLDKEIKLLNQLSVSPNPSDGLLQLKIENELQTMGKLSILHINGLLIHRQSLNGQKNIAINLSHLTSGIYVIKIGNQEYMGTTKWVKK